MPLIIFLTLLPIAAIWIGMYVLKNVYWTFFLLHIVCLLPVIVWGYPVWKPGIKRPTARQLGWVLSTSAIFCLIALAAYLLLGNLFLEDSSVFSLLRNQGYRRGILLPMTFYFIFVNSILEELYWRGTIMAVVDRLSKGRIHFGIVWSAFAYSIYHYPILRLVVYPGWAEFGVLLLFLYGIMLAVVYRRTGSLVISALVHAFGTDLTAMMLMTALLIRLKQHLI